MNAYEVNSGGSSQNTLGGRAPERLVGAWVAFAIISSRWKNWGAGQKVRGPRPPGPGLEPPLEVKAGISVIAGNTV